MSEHPSPPNFKPQWQVKLRTNRFLMVILQALLALVFLTLWQYASGRFIDEFMISSPWAVADRLWKWFSSGSIYVHIWATVLETLLGFAIGAVIGIILGIWLGLTPFAARLLDPFIWAINALPKVALAPLFLLWFGLGMESKVALGASLVVFLVFANTYSGVTEVDPDLIDCLKLMKATPQQLLAKVILPSATSWIFVGLKTSVPYALIGAIIGELIAANKGLGFLVQKAGSEFDTAGVFAALTVIALLAISFNEIVSAMQRRLERWKVLSRD
jgi:NitT/TauT family transport system permease protein